MAHDPHPLTLIVGFAVATIVAILAMLFLGDHVAPPPERSLEQPRIEHPRNERSIILRDY
jgi:hypothetical protein